MCVDEVQDFAGHDFNFLLELCRAEISVMCCGDSYQNTFDTSHDGNVNSTLLDDINRYESRFITAGSMADRDTLSRTWRCSATVCIYHRYDCYSLNWGVSKGLDHFQEVCIVMEPAHWKLLSRQELAALPPLPRNRLYVVCSRARGNIYFVPETHLRRFRK